MEKVIQAKDLLKTSGIITASPEATLKEALARLTRSHDAVFVFNDQGKFLGVINPYYAIFKSNHPPQTKLVHCLFNPPHLSLDMYIWDIAQLMVQSKVYFLPVFENNTNFVGIVTVNRVLLAILSNNELVGRLQIKTKKNIITIAQNSSLATTYTLMRDKQVARLPVVDTHNHLVGIVTRFDIRAAFAEPKQKVSWLSRVGEKENFLDQPIEGYFKKMIVSAPNATPPRKILELILNKEVGSVVIVDADRKPVGLVSTTDLLEAIARLRPDLGLEIELKVERGFVHKAQLEEMLARFVAKINKFNPVRRVHFVLEGEKNPAGKISRYTSHLQIVRKDGMQVVGKAMDYDWKKSVHEVLDKVKHQLPS